MKPGRNDPCSCGSGKKFKHCCEGKVAARYSAPSPSPNELNQLVALYNSRRYAELENSSQTLISRYPDFGFAWKLLGAAQQMQGKNALGAFQKTAKLMPEDAEAHFNLGVVQKSLGLLEDAAASYRRAIQIKPGYAEAHGNLGNTLKDLGQLDAAVTSFRRAMQIDPGSATSLNNLATVLKDLGKFDEAIASYQRAIQLSPGYAEAHSNLGNALKELGKPAEAISHFRLAVQLKPDSAHAHFNLGNALKDTTQLNEAMISYRRALEIQPDYVEALSNLGSTLKEIGLLDEAIACYRHALEIQPEHVEARSNPGDTLNTPIQPNDVLAGYRRAMEMGNDIPGLYSRLLFTLNYSANHSPSACLDEARKYGRSVSQQVTARFTDWQCAEVPERLRVGVVSGDLRNHPVGYFLESLLAELDPARVELIAYPSDPKTDALTSRIQPFFSAWKPLVGINDKEAARLIHADGVHILLDLSGHSRHGRLPMFAWKPAPVQVSWLGYFATTGVTEIDYLLADKVGVPESHRSNFSEKVWYLPDTRLCFSAPDTTLPVAPLPAQKSGHITFGCFQNMAKVDDTVLTTWAKILSALPDSRLRWQCYQLGDQVVVKQLLARVQKLGIDPERITLQGSVAREAYLAAHSEVDMVLDSFPYPGGTTTCEALWMGVPTLTLAGDTLLARQGASLMTAAGFNNWVATSKEDYVNRAVALASDISKLSALRSGLREQVKASPLFDAPRFARNFEDALWGMWQATVDSDTPSK